MKKYRMLSLVVVAAFLAAAMIAPISTAGTVNLVLDHKDNSANLTVASTSELMVKTNSTNGISSVAFGILKNLFNTSYNYSLIANSSANATIQNVNSMFKSFNSSLAVSYFSMSLKGNQTMANKTEFIDNYSSSLTLNMSGVFSGKIANLSWRNGLSGSNISKWSNGGASANLSYQSFHSNLSLYNLSGFSKSLSSWTRTYNAATNITTFTTHSSTVTQVSFYNLTSNLTIRYTSDPVYTIMVHGDAVASANSILLENSPNGTFTVWYAIAAVVVVVGVIGAMSLRKRRLS